MCAGLAAFAKVRLGAASLELGVDVVIRAESEGYPFIEVIRAVSRHQPPWSLQLGVAPRDQEAGSGQQRGRVGDADGERQAN